MNLFYTLNLITPSDYEDRWEVLESYDSVEEAIECATLVQNICRFGSWCEITVENWG